MGKKSAHSILNTFPLVILFASLVMDVIFLLTQYSLLAEIAFYMIALGIVGGFAAALFGLIDWIEIPGGTPAKRMGMIHGTGNALFLTLFIISWFLRSGSPDTYSIIVALIACVLATVMVKIGHELTAPTIDTQVS